MADLDENAFGYLLFMWFELQVVKPGDEVFDGDLAEFAYMAVAHLNIQGFLAQPVSFTIGAFGAAAVTGEENAVLYLIEIAFHLCEEVVDALGVIVAVPEGL